MPKPKSPRRSRAPKPKAAPKVKVKVERIAHVPERYDAINAAAALMKAVEVHPLLDNDIDDAEVIDVARDETTGQYSSAPARAPQHTPQPPKLLQPIPPDVRRRLDELRGDLRKCSLPIDALMIHYGPTAEADGVAPFPQYPRPKGEPRFCEPLDTCIMSAKSTPWSENADGLLVWTRNDADRVQFWTTARRTGRELLPYLGSESEREDVRAHEHEDAWFLARVLAALPDRSLWTFGANGWPIGLPAHLDELRELATQAPDLIPAKWLDRLPDAWCVTTDDLATACVQHLDALLADTTTATERETMPEAPEGISASTHARLWRIATSIGDWFGVGDLRRDPQAKAGERTISKWCNGLAPTHLEARGEKGGRRYRCRRMR